MYLRKRKRGFEVRKAWVVSVDMGYGHQRAAYPLKDIAYERIITANSDKLVTPREKKLWKKSQWFYETVSRLTSVPGLGRLMFKLYDRLQAIPDFYPTADLSNPSLQTLYLDYLIRKKKFNSSLMDYIKRHNLPMVTTHFIPAIAAEYYNVKDIYCVVTDTDINRIWVPKNPHNTRITFLASCEHTVKRLKQYGVPDDKVILTGFPLPKENLGGEDLSVLKKDVGNRLPNLDPGGKYIIPYKSTIKEKLGKNYKTKSNHKLTITFITGGAGAQMTIGLQALVSLKNKIINNEIKINLAAGTRIEVAEYYRNNIIGMGFGKYLGKSINIIFAWDKPTYFRVMNYVLHTTDILWSKPSELSFYTALGLPIIIAPPIGAHEYYNMKWLMQLGSGFPQENPDCTDEWLNDWIKSGRLAEAAFEGFLEAPNLGTYNIEKIVLNSRNKIKKNKKTKLNN
jgi:hypothetical protein